MQKKKIIPKTSAAQNSEEKNFIADSACYFQ